MASKTVAKPVKPSPTGNLKPLVTGLSKGPVNTASKGPVTAASKGPVIAPWAKAPTASAKKPKARRVPKTNASGTPTGRGTGQQHQQRGTGQAVPGAGKPAPPAQQSQQYVEPPLQPDGYDVTNGGSPKVPQPLREARVKAIYVEFLKIADNNPQAKNHVVLKIDFLPGPDSLYPGGYQGVRINMDVDQDANSESSEGGSSIQPGTLYVKPLRYLLASNSSVRTFGLVPGEYAVTLGHLLHVIVECHALHCFNFKEKNARYFGCRDFM